MFVPNTHESGSAGSFVSRERARAAAYFLRHFPEACNWMGAPYRLSPDFARLNLARSIRDEAEAYFTCSEIVWHRHRNHGLSSQVCCLNFLMPLATRPQLLSRLVGRALGIDPPRMLPVENGPSGEPWFVGFEWIGHTDYLRETGKSGTRTRGANVTSADAVVRFESSGLSETLLVEWKYTESYGAPLRKDGNETRARRYADLVVAPAGPMRADRGLQLEEFFFEPLYQLLRQQILARRMELCREDGATRVRLLHISPSANLRLHRVTSPALRRFDEGDVFTLFASLLNDSADGVPRFVARETADLFGPLLADPGRDGEEWAGYLRDRYAFLGAG